MRPPATSWLRSFAYVVTHYKLLRAQKIIIHPGAIIVKSQLGSCTRIYPNSRIEYSEVGSFSYVSANCTVLGSTIGAFTSIGPSSRIGLEDHPLHYVSTHPAFYSKKAISGSTFKHTGTPQNLSPTSIGSDVWLGSNVLVKGGVSIGHGSVVGAGSVVVSDLEPYGIYGGVPARLIRNRFDENIKKRLLDLRWWEKPLIEIENNSPLFHDIDLLLSSGFANQA